MLRQEIISTPGAELNCDVIEEDGEYVADAVVHLRKVGFEGLERSRVVQGGVFSQGVVIVEVAGSFLEETLRAGELWRARWI